MLTVNRIFVVGVALGIVATAHAGEPYKAAGPNDLHMYWVKQKPAQKFPPFSRSTMRKHMNVCVSVGFIVGTDGVPQQLRILRSITSKPDDVEETKRIETAATNATALLRYEPAPGNQTRAPVFTYTTMSMAVSSSGSTPATVIRHTDEVDQSCRIPTFVADVDSGAIKP